MKFKYLALVASAVSAALLLTGTANAKPKTMLNSAQGFAVLGGSAVTLTNAAVVGDVGVDLGGAFTNTTSTISGTLHVGDLVAQQAYEDFLLAYVALGQTPCETTLSGSLAGLFLTPGVYCVAAGSTTTGGTLTLVGSSTDTWIFKIGTSGVGALTGTNFNVVMSSGETCNSNVYWWTAQAATLTDSVFIGSILAGTSITVTNGSFNGQALATLAVTLTGTAVSVCNNVGSPPNKPKANEGVGNGVDGNTPGHLHNGGNDDPGFTPGNPGAKSKPKG